MRTGWLALREGFRRLGRYWPALLAAYVVNLLSALALAVFPAAGLLQGARRPALELAANGISANTVVDFLGAGINNAMMGINPDGRALPFAALWALITAAVLPFLAGLPASLVNGGVVLADVESPAPWRWKRFFWGCWHWFGAFILLGLVQVLLTALVAVPAAVLMGLALSQAPWVLWVVGPLLAVYLAVTFVVFEVAGVWLVSRSTRNFAQALRAALGCLRRQAGPFAALYALTLAGLGLLHALYTWGLWPHLPLALWPLVLLVQQAFILARLAARLVRLSSCSALMPARETA